MKIWMDNRHIDGVVLKPMLCVLFRDRYIGIRFGREEYVAWTEEDSRHSSFKWWYFFGKRISVRTGRLK